MSLSEKIILFLCFGHTCWFYSYTIYCCIRAIYIKNKDKREICVTNCCKSSVKLKGENGSFHYVCKKCGKKCNISLNV